MNRLQLARGAKNIIDTCAMVARGERVLIVTDFELVSSAEMLASFAHAKGADVTVTVMEPRDVDGAEPTDSVTAAMAAADVVLMPVMMSLAHAAATRAALAKGARVLSLTALSEPLLASDAWQADFVGLRPKTVALAEAFELAKEVRITSEAGTDLRVRKDGRRGNAHACIVDTPGSFSGAPNIEANFSPVEGSAEGVFVADGSIPYLGIGMLSAPVTFVIEAGRVVRVEGGRQADRIRDVWAEQGDPNVYNIAQVAVGMNPMIPAVVGELGCNYDEGAYGTVHIGIGTNSSLGGTVKAATHFDALMNAPTLTLDGRAVLKAGAFV